MKGKKKNQIFKMDKKTIRNIVLKNLSLAFQLSANALCRAEFNVLQHKCMHATIFSESQFTND